MKLYKTGIMRVNMMITVIICAVTLNTASFAQPGRPDDKESRWRKILSQLDLTAEQEKQIKERKEAMRERKKALKENMKQKKKELKDAINSSEIDRAKINALIEDMKNLSGEKLQLMVDGILSTREILTPEQYKKMKEMIELRKRAREAGGASYFGGHKKNKDSDDGLSDI